MGILLILVGLGVLYVVVTTPSFGFLASLLVTLVALLLVVAGILSFFDRPDSE